MRVSDVDDDVSIVGAGASGAAVAWRLAETKMRIASPGQGGCTRPHDDPGTQTGRQLARFVDGFVNEWATSPCTCVRTAGRPIDDGGLPVWIVDHGTVGSSTILRATATSVVDARGRAGDVRGLSSVDGSGVVTSAGVDPTRITRAVAPHIADRMERQLANLFG
jgi:choline dehydrogenase-like flavoprotein